MVIFNEKPGVMKAFFAFLLAIGLIIILQANSNAQALYSAVPVSDSGTTSNSISNANTSRCLAVAPNGTIYALYHGTNGIRVAKSINRGASFTSSVLVKNSDFESEIAVSSNSKVYVTWVDSTNAYISVSTDGAQTFASPVKVGTATSSVHMAVDGDYIYLIDRPGSSFYYSSDGGQTFTKVTFNETYVFSDVHVNPLTGEVIVQKDQPSIVYYISKDHGKTFGSQKVPNASVNYSVGAVSAGPKGTYLFVAGYSTMSTRINIADNSAKTLSFGSSSTAQGRSLSVDGFGNVVTGFINGGNVYYAVSNDLGDTFGTTCTVAAANMANAAANTTNGDVMFLYEVGGKIYLSVFKDELKGYSLDISTTNLNFSNQQVGTQSTENTITVWNKGSSDINIKNVNITGSDFIVTNNLGSVLKAGQAYTITVKFSPSDTGSRTGLISILTDASTEPRTIQLTGTGIDSTAPTITIDPYDTNPTNQSITVTASTNKGTLNATTHTFDTNGTFTFTSVDKSGNTSSKTITITNIYKDAPVITIAPYTTDPTNKDITVAASAVSNTPGGATLNQNSYTFTENGSFTFIATDAAGNTASKTITITNIGKSAPVITIAPYNTDPTNKSITVTASSDKGTLNESSHTFDLNGEFTFTATDALGNTSSKTVTITNIDKVAPVISIEPYDTNPTYNSITVTASVNEGTLDESTHTFNSNGEFTFTAVDSVGNTSSTTVSITNILDKSALSQPETHVSQNALSDITTAVYGGTPVSLMNGTSTLIPGTDYIISGSNITIKKGYLTYYFSKFPNQNLYLNVILSNGQSIVLTVYIGDSSHPVIESTDITYNGTDARVGCELYGNYFASLKAGDIPLIQKIDYTYSNDTHELIIRKGFIENYFSKNSVDLKLDIKFTGGDVKSITISKK